MGYDIHWNGTFRLPQDRRADALAAILAAHDSEPFWSNPLFQEKRDRGESVTFDEVFGEVLATSSYSIKVDGLTHGTEVEWLDDDEINFEGDNRSGWGGDDLIKAIAPFVIDGTVYAEGEDGEKWRYVFTGSGAVMQDAHEIYGLSPQLAEKYQAEVDREAVAQ